MPRTWDYFILTAANARQAEAYRRQISARLRAGALTEAAQTLVVPDMEGRRIGSGGSTLVCLRAVLNREGELSDFAQVEERLRRRRVLIVHAGGDSRRLPAYSPCGKIFVPLPGENSGPVIQTLFDRLLSIFSALPANPEGQVVVASGDALILFDPSAVDLSKPGVTALGAPVTPEEAARHGVFCVDGQAAVRLYLQKPSIAEQRAAGAVDAAGRALLDLGVMSFSAGASAALLRTFCHITGDQNRGLTWRPEFEPALLEQGLDLYREICCAMGTETTLARYIRSAYASGSQWPATLLAELFRALCEIPLHLQVLDECRFLHFGSTRQLISSGLALIAEDTGAPPKPAPITLTTVVQPGGAVTGGASWVEGCRVGAPLYLSGDNVVAGLEVSEPLQLPAGACLDVLAGSSRRGEPVWFVRCYGVGDTFKHAIGAGATFCGTPLASWIQEAGLTPAAIWDDGVREEDRTLWNARVFPAEREHSGYRRWLWMFCPGRATAAEKRAFADADRYSAAEVALLADEESFYAARQALYAHAC